MNNMDGKYTATFNSWNNVAAQYQQYFMHLDMYNDTYDAFCGLLPENSGTILEIGCGPGNITRYMLNQRPEVTIDAIDVAPAMIALAKQNNPVANFIEMDCRDIANMNKQYDAVMCGFCIPYLSRTDVNKLLKDCNILLNKEGIIYLSAIEGNYNSSGLETSSDGANSMYVYYYTQTDLLQMLNENSFSLTNTFYKQYQKKDGSSSVHVILIARKN